MGQILHGSATTTAAVRRAIQHSQESLIVLADRYDINPKTVAKWRARETVEDRKKIEDPSYPPSSSSSSMVQGRKAESRAEIGVEPDDPDLLP